MEALALFLCKEPLIPEQFHFNDAAISEPDRQLSGSVDLRKLSLLIANGEHPFPTDLDKESQTRLANLIRKQRCNSLMDLFARQIAAEIHQQNNRLV